MGKKAEKEFYGLDDYPDYNGKKKKKGKKKKSKLRGLMKFLLVFLVTLLIVLGAGYAYLDHKFKQGLYQERSKQDYQITDQQKEEDYDALYGKSDEAINILILGTDDGGYRSDVTMLVHYDPHSKTTSLFSIPRDYRVSLSLQAQQTLNYYAPFIKFTEIFSYCKIAEMESPASYVTQVVEEMLGVKINHFVLVDLSSFREAVDSVGGVEVYIPQAMYWSDPYQDLYINLEPGLQLVDGKKAEQLVRFRQNSDGTGYGDFGRMQMQQYFLTAYAKKLLSLQSIPKIKKIVTPLAEMLTTDASLADALWILNTAKDADFNRVNAHTLPGYDEYINDIYFFSPRADVDIRDYFRKTVMDDAEGFDQNSKEYKIEVYTSTFEQEQKALNLKDKLLQDGYQAEYKGLDQRERILKSLILVPDEKSGGDLKKYLDISEIVIDPYPSDEKTISIVIGEVQAE